MRPSESLTPAVAALLLVLVSWPAAAQTEAVAAGRSRFAAQGRVEYIVGNAPVILSAPHGGRLKPASIPDRTVGTLLTDSYTDLLARDFARAFHQRTGSHAHVIVCHLKRIKVDCNRDIREAAQGNPEAEETWNAFHALIDEARGSVQRTHGSGLYLDLHGHGRPEGWIMLGYLLTNRDLQRDEKALAALADRSSIRSLAGRGGVPFVELLRGETSFGGLLQRRGYPAVPSPEHPHAGESTFFSGGYNVRRHGSRDGGTIGAIQVECPRKGVRDTQAHRQAFASALADAVVAYLELESEIPQLEGAGGRVDTDD